MQSGMAFEVLASTESRQADGALKWPVRWLSPRDSRDRHGVDLTCVVALSHKTR